MVICLEQRADLHMAQLMPLPLTVSCFNKIQIGFTFLVLAHLGSPRRKAIKRVCVSFLGMPRRACGQYFQPYSFLGMFRRAIGQYFQLYSFLGMPRRACGQ